MKTRKSTITLMSLLVGLSLLNTSCKKDNSNTKNELLGIPKIESMTMTTSFISDTLYTKYAYDSQGRILSSISKRNNLPYNEYTYSYSYNDSSIIEKIKSIDTITYYIVNGYDKYIYITDEKNYESIISKDDFYKTDENSQIIKNNNVIKEIDGSTEITYSYYLDKNNSIGFKNKGINYKDNKNLIKTKTSSNGVTTTYLYEFDSLARVKKQIIQENSQTTVFTYSYY